MQLTALGASPSQWLNSVPVLGPAVSGFEKFLNPGNPPSPLTGVVTPKSTALADWQNGSGSRIAFSSTNEQLLTGFRQRLQELMSQQGLNPGDQPVVLQSDGLGGVSVANSHPHAETINRLLAEDTNLGRWFQELQTSAQSSQDSLFSDHPQQSFQIALWDQQAIGRWGT